MKKYVAIFAVILASALVFAYKAIHAGKEETLTQGDIVRLEDAIIVEGIKMDSDEPLQEEESPEGSIIFDDAFESGSLGTGTRGKHPEKLREDKKVISFDLLKKKDARWHLSKYRIKKKDNIWKIAERFHTAPAIIAQVNRIKDPGMLRAGRQILVPNRDGYYYRVKQGDNLGKIARAHKTTSLTLSAQNRIKGEKIAIGQKIFIPDAEPIKVDEKPRKAAVMVARKERTSIHKAAEKPKTMARAADPRFRILWPLQGKITSGFGNRIDPFSKQRRFHCGVDISADIGLPIKAAADGRVIFSGWKEGYGQMIVIRHEGGYITVYAHNSRNLVRENDMVRRGGIIGYTGMTGAVTGAHLHFELRKYVTPLNPRRFLKI